MIKKIIIFSTLFICVIFLSNAHNKNKQLSSTLMQHINHTNFIIDSEGNPSEALKAILKATNITHDDSLASIISATQRTQNDGGWLRATGKERWEIDELFIQKRESLFSIFKNLGVLDQVIPLQTHYDYALLLGATAYRVRTRLRHLIELWNNGVQFNTIVVLCGQRTLDPQLESLDVLLNANNGVLPFKSDWQFNGAIPKTETDMMQLVFEQSALPEEWKNLSIIFIDTPQQLQENGSWKRPSTQDTVEAWFAINPTPGSILAISNQPFVGYQDTALRRFIPATFTIETIGQAASASIKIATLLDNMARWLYIEYHRCIERNNSSSNCLGLREVDTSFFCSNFFL